MKLHSMQQSVITGVLTFKGNVMGMNMLLWGILQQICKYNIFEQDKNLKQNIILKIIYIFL